MINIIKNIKIIILLSFLDTYFFKQKIKIEIKISNYEFFIYVLILILFYFFIFQKCDLLR